VTEEELATAARDLQDVGYEPETVNIALTAPPSPVEYYHFTFA